MSRLRRLLPLTAALVGLAWAHSTHAQATGEAAAADAAHWPPVAALKSEYIQCERVSSQRRLSMHAAARCAAVGEQLLERGFDGDLDRLLAWWREERETRTAGLMR